MEATYYEGWTIKTHLASRGFGVVMTAPCGNTFQQPTIFWQSQGSAQRYAQKFIEWSLKLEDQRREQDLSMRNPDGCTEFKQS
jgi:hypothetical protein